MSSLFKNSFLVSLAASIGSLSFVFIAQFGFNLLPCVLCIYQRWPYALVIVVSLAGLALAKKVGEKLFQFVVAAGFAATAAIGAFHVGVEQGWWEGLTGCVADTSQSQTLAELKSQIMSAPLIKCDEIAWELFGISMAGYNALFASALAIFMILAMFKINTRI
ncbi:MAG: disulfide bond formation protein B [Sneathiella sp.]|nr:disulfide bond formation protein B [Sneathiella sp.]